MSKKPAPQKTQRQTRPARATDDITLEQRAFEPINKKGDVVAGVALARQLLRADLLVNGAEYDAIELAQKLAGPVERGSDGTMAWEHVCKQTFAAMVAGIALGQLVHPDVFTANGGVTGARGRR
jgi:hypothetical protein